MKSEGWITLCVFFFGPKLFPFWVHWNSKCDEIKSRGCVGALVSSLNHNIGDDVDVMFFMLMMTFFFYRHQQDTALRCLDLPCVINHTHLTSFSRKLANAANDKIRSRTENLTRTATLKLKLYSLMMTTMLKCDHIYIFSWNSIGTIWEICGWKERCLQYSQILTCR